MKAVDVVIPVYDGYTETVACLESVLATVPPAWARIVVVNDASPEPRITAHLRDLKALWPQLVLLENDDNLGFVATANRGMRYDESRDVLLLNSDVEVCGDWLWRLREAAYHNERVGSITPFSNNATICSFPDFCKDNRLLFDLDPAHIDSAFTDLFDKERVFDIPTGVGCCMFIRRDCLDQVGYFDEEAFGRGYGEENDWCQRASKMDWRNLHLANCFVFHRGGVSFGAEQNPRVARAMELLDQRYPHYHRSIQSFVASDPGRDYRTQALLELFSRQRRPKVAFLSHKLGGGAQQHVDELACLYQERALFVQITPETEGRSVSLAFFDGGRRLQDGLYFDIEREYAGLVELLRMLGIGRVHFHHTMGLPPQLWVLAGDLGCEYDLTIHDYYLLNGNPTLTDAEARFVPEDAPDFDSRCAQHYPLPAEVSAEDWRQNQRLLVENAHRVIFPSVDCRERFLRFFDVRQAVVAWHPDYQQSRPYPEPVRRHGSERPLRVLVLGAISREKGADVLESVADAMHSQAVEFHLLGYAYRALSSAVHTHGPYENARVYELVEEVAPDVVWFPALWPETYSYTLSIAMHLGLPVVVPDIGAFVERVRGRPLSCILGWNTDTVGWQAFWRGVVKAGLPVQEGLVPADGAAPAARDDFYNGDYLAAVPFLRGTLGQETRRGLGNNYHAGAPQLTRTERMLEKIWSFSRRPLVSRAISIVPFRLQRAIKRRLSSRPMHDIVRRP